LTSVQTFRLELCTPQLYHAYHSCMFQPSYRVSTFWYPWQYLVKRWRLTGAYHAAGGLGVAISPSPQNNYRVTKMRQILRHAMLVLIQWCYWRLWSGVYIFSKNPGAVSKFWAPVVWHEARSILRVHHLTECCHPGQLAPGIFAPRLMIMVNKINVKVPLHTVKVYRGNKGVAPFILNLGHRLRRVMMIITVKKVKPSLCPSWRRSEWRCNSFYSWPILRLRWGQLHALAALPLEKEYPMSVE